MKSTTRLDRMMWRSEDVRAMMVPFAVSKLSAAFIKELPTDEHTRDHVQLMLGEQHLPAFLKVGEVEVDDWLPEDEFATVWVLFENAARHPVETRK